MLFDFSTRLVGRGVGQAAARTLRRCGPSAGAVLGCWLAAFAAGVVVSLSLPSHLSSSFAVPGSESQRAEQALARGFGERPAGTFTVVFPFTMLRPATTGAPARPARARRDGASRREGRHVPRRGRSRLRGRRDDSRACSRRSATRAIFAMPSVRTARRRPSSLASRPSSTTSSRSLASDLRRGEAIAIPLAVLVLALVLGLSIALAIPFVFAACAIGGSLVLLYGAAHLFAITPYAVNLVELLGLGLAVDYSLVIVSRYREELEQRSGRGRPQSSGRWRAPEGLSSSRGSRLRSGWRSFSSSAFLSSRQWGLRACWFRSSRSPQH